MRLAEYRATPRPRRPDTQSSARLNSGPTYGYEHDGSETEISLEDGYVFAVLPRCRGDMGLLDGNLTRLESGTVYVEPGT